MPMIKNILLLLPILVTAKQQSATTKPNSFAVTVRVQIGNDAYLNNLGKS